MRNHHHNLKLRQIKELMINPQQRYYRRKRKYKHRSNNDNNNNNKKSKRIQNLTQILK